MTVNHSTTIETAPTLKLRTNQRNILRLVAQHEHRYPNTPCYLGKVTASRQNVFIKAVHSLEQLKLVQIDRCSDNFRAWTIKLLVPLEVVIPQTLNQQLP